MRAQSQKKTKNTQAEIHPSPLLRLSSWIFSALPENKQMLALSATYPESLAQHLTRYMREPTFVRLNPSDMGLKGKTLKNSNSKCKIITSYQKHSGRLAIPLQKNEENKNTRGASHSLKLICCRGCCPCAPPARSEAVLQAGAVPSFTSQGFRGEGAALAGAFQ